jgi:hypothetical protein
VQFFYCSSGDQLDGAGGAAIAVVHFAWTVKL